MKRSLALFTIGGLLGTALGSWLGPKAVSYWFAPPVQNSHFNCNAEITWAMQSLIKWQALSAGVWAVIVVIAGTLIARAWRQRAARKAAATAIAPGPHS